MPFNMRRPAIYFARITFSETRFVLLCEDDGVGIDPHFLSNTGRHGHFGLIGMRERAQKIGATLRAQRNTKGGTEIELRVAARIAYLPTEKDYHGLIREPEVG